MLFLSSFNVYHCFTIPCSWIRFFSSSCHLIQYFNTKYCHEIRLYITQQTNRFRDGQPVFPQSHQSSWSPCVHRTDISFMEVLHPYAPLVLTNNLKVLATVLVRSRRAIPSYTLLNTAACCLMVVSSNQSLSIPANITITFYVRYAINTFTFLGNILGFCHHPRCLLTKHVIYTAGCSRHQMNHRDHFMPSLQKISSQSILITINMSKI